MRVNLGIPHQSASSPGSGHRIWCRLPERASEVRCARPGSVVRLLPVLTLCSPGFRQWLHLVARRLGDALAGPRVGRTANPAEPGNVIGPALR